MKGLTICPTPLGNLSDISKRQLETLQNADIILCEDTRSTGKLLERLEIRRIDGVPLLWSYHDHNESQRLVSIMESLSEGKKVVLVSDAGTPTISDPGFRVVAQARLEGFPVVALPGPVAAMVALSASGLPSDRVLFEGFLPAKRGERKKRLLSAKESAATVLLYESPKRLRALLEDIGEIFEESPIVVGRELTKKFESYYSGTAKEVLLKLPDPVKGECVVVISKTSKQVDHVDAKKLVHQLAKAGVNPKSIRSVVREHYGVSKKDIFNWLEELKS